MGYAYPASKSCLSKSHRVLPKFKRHYLILIDSEGVAIIEADCKSSFCRVHLTLGPGSAEQSLKQLENFIPWNGEAFFLVDELDAGEATVYVVREDHTLP